MSLKDEIESPGLVKYVVEFLIEHALVETATRAVGRPGDPSPDPSVFIASIEHDLMLSDLVDLRLLMVGEDSPSVKLRVLRHYFQIMEESGFRDPAPMIKELEAACSRLHVVISDQLQHIVRHQSFIWLQHVWRQLAQIAADLEKHGAGGRQNSHMFVVHLTTEELETCRANHLQDSVQEKLRQLAPRPRLCRREALLPLVQTVMNTCRHLHARGYDARYCATYNTITILLTEDTDGLVLQKS